MILHAIAVCVVSILCIIVAAFIYLRPLQTIELQKKFYATINWRMEPISLPKEIRNTKIIGLFLLAFVVVTLFIFIRR